MKRLSIPQIVRMHSALIKETGGLHPYRGWKIARIPAERKIKYGCQQKIWDKPTFN
jgi:hypothetical protein